MWHQWFNHNFSNLLFVCKENTINDFIQQFYSSSTIIKSTTTYVRAAVDVERMHCALQFCPHWKWKILHNMTQFQPNRRYLMYSYE